MQATAKPKSKVNLNPVQFKHLSIKGSQVNEESRTVSGYLSIFNVVDSDGDMIVKGAFAKSISERGPDSSSNRKIAFLWQHDMKDPIGKMTVLKEDNQGLYFEAALDLGIPNADRALQQLKSGTLDQFSIGFQYVWDKMEYDETLDAFICKEINLFEGSVVTLGANEFTFFDGMKSNVMKDEKQKLIKETETFIKSLPPNVQYDCRQLIAKNISLATAKVKASNQSDEDMADGDPGDQGNSTDTEYINKALQIHSKGIGMIQDYSKSVTDGDLQDCMKDMDGMHTDCMTKMLDIKTRLQGGKSLSKPSDKTLDEPIVDLKSAISKTNFFNSLIN